MKKFVKICLISIVLIGVFAVTFCATYLTTNYVKYQSLPLNAETLTSPSLSIDVYSSENIKMEDENQFNGDYCKLEDLSEHTKEAFISIEDKDFYKHHGLNKKRIVKAMINNLKSGKLKEGASTISQQLIKNTHLSSEKTFDRKLKEMALTKKLEKNFSKDEILESYLNIIFFGNNCYGIEDASKYYFNKSAKNLTLEESCTLAGMIKAPSRYSPITNPENCKARRDLVLSEMEKDGKITASEKITAQNKPLTLSITPHTRNKLNSYSQASIDEATKLLNTTAKQLALGGYKLHTYFDKDKQKALENAIAQNKVEGLSDAGIVIDNRSHGIKAYVADADYKISEIKRQPASCIKPLLVYAPALNENVISPSTQILDEPLKIGGYEPENVNKKFAGYMSITDAVKNSVNIPAIKVLSYIGIDTGMQYAEKLGLSFDEKDSSYALALGGMTYGVSLQDLTSAYTVFPNGGEFAPSHFIQYITDKNNKIVYMHKPQEKMVFREDSAYLMTNILQESVKSGTARKLSDIKSTSLASKTGTVGRRDGNIDAYNITFCPEETIGVWFGQLSNTPSNIASGREPTNAVKAYVSTQSYNQRELELPSSITTAKIDTLTKETEHRIVLASPYSPERYKETAIFSRFNMPAEVSKNFTEKPEINAECVTENGQAVLTLQAEKHIEYQIFKDNIPYQTLKDKQGKITVRLPMTNSETVIKIQANYAGENSSQTEKSFNLVKSNTNNVERNKEKWYI